MKNLSWVFVKRESKCGKSRIKTTYEAKKLLTFEFGILNLIPIRSVEKVWKELRLSFLQENSFV